MLCFVNGGRNSEISPPKLLKSQRLSLGSYSMSIKSAPDCPTSVIAGVSLIYTSACERSNETIGGWKIRMFVVTREATSSIRTYCDLPA